MGQTKRSGSRRARPLGGVFILSLSVVFVSVESQLSGVFQGMTPRPVCVSQYALANYACSMIPYSPLPPPAPPSPPTEEHRHHRSSRHGHGHHHRHRSPEHEGSAEEEDCCRWLREIDNDCVCDMLVRLPDFLSRPVHDYSVAVGLTCNVTYVCSGRVIRK